MFLYARGKLRLISEIDLMRIRPALCNISYSQNRQMDINNLTGMCYISIPNVVYKSGFNQVKLCGCRSSAYSIKPLHIVRDFSTK